MLSGYLIHFNITRRTTQYEFYELVYNYLSNLSEYNSIKLTDLILYRMSETEKENELLQNEPFYLCPKMDQIFILFLERLPPISIYGYFCNESCDLTDDSGIDYKVISLNIYDKTKQYPENKLLTQEYLVRRPTSENDILIPQIWSMDNIIVKYMRYDRWEDIGYIENPNPSLIINDLPNLTFEFIYKHPYFSMGTPEGFRRRGVFIKLIYKDLIRLMKYYLTGSDSDSDSDSNED
jgi:hypothetical protein